MTAGKSSLLLPVLLITVGTGWLLTTLGVAPEIDWVWTLGLAVTGILPFITIGFDKVTFVAGTFLVVASSLSLLRQTGRLALDVEIPILVIVSGALLLSARCSVIPVPTWVVPVKREEP